jgi:hypothetical protein
MFNEISLLKMSTGFYGNRINDTTISPTYWELTYEIIPTEVSVEGKINRGEIAYEKLKFWIDYILNDLTVSEHSNELAMQMSYMFENPTMLTPYSPTNNHLIQLLHSKFSAIVGDDLYIGKMTLSSSETDSVCVFNTDEGAYSLPEGDEYIVGMYHDKPWWQRKTMDFADFTKEEIDSDEALREFIENEDPLVTFERDIIESVAEATNRKPQTAEIIKVPKKWKPKIV